MKVETILDQIDLGSMALPEFQRGYVWNREQVRGLMHSLYRKHPVGSLLVWVTKTESAKARGGGDLSPGWVKLLLDGQQRITTLYGIIRGNPPKFFDGNLQAFTGLFFDLESEVFEFYRSSKMKGNPLWISITELMQTGAGPAIGRFLNKPEYEAKLNTYLHRLNQIDNIKQVDLHIDEVTGEEKTVDVVVDIFNRVNSGGTKLSKGDLALAKICAQWPEARDEMKSRLEKWQKSGFRFKLEWLLRNINTILTGEALFSSLKDVDTESFKRGLNLAEKTIDKLLNLIAGRLGLDHDRVLGSRYSFPVMSRYLADRNFHMANFRERDKLVFWYIHTFLWGRYAGSTETVLNHDLSLIEKQDGALDRLIEQLRQNRGDLRLNSKDFIGFSRGARFFPLLYMLTRVWRAKDWDSGVELSNNMLGNLCRLQVHHIFPKAKLYEFGYARPQVNALANFTFLTQETNLSVSDREPAEYIPAFEMKNPGVVASHWIPMNPDLWKIENYENFLAERRNLLAKAANEFLDGLLRGEAKPEEAIEDMLERIPSGVVGGISGDREFQLLEDINQWLEDQGLPSGELSYEIIDANTNEPIASLDLAWPDGLQEGLSEPVALLIDEGADVEDAANQAGFKYFTDVDRFRSYVESEILALQSDNA